MKLLLLTCLTLIFISCNKDKDFENESYISKRTERNEIHGLDFSNLSSTRKIQKVLNLLDRGVLSENEAAYRSNRIISIDYFEDNKIIDKFEIKSLDRILDLIAQSQISNLELLSTITPKNSKKHRSIEDTLVFITKNNDSLFKTYLILKYFELREINLTPAISRLLVKIYESSSGQWFLKTNNDVKNSFYLKVLTVILKNHKDGKLPVSRITLSTVLNLSKNLLKTSDPIIEISHCYTFLDFYFSFNVLKFDDEYRDSFNHWQIHIDHQLDNLIKGLNQKTYPADITNINPQISLKFRKNNLIADYTQKFLNLKISPFMKLYYKVRDLRAKKAVEVKELNQLKNYATQALEIFYTGKNYNFNLKDYALAQPLNESLILVPGIYKMSQNETLRFDSVHFSILSFIYAPGLKVSIDVKELTYPWIEVGGRSSILKEEERYPKSGIPHQLKYVHLPDVAHGNPVATVRGIREHNTAPRDFTPCRFDGQSVSWVCVVQMSLQYSDGSEPDQQRTGAKGEDAGMVVLENLQLIHGHGIISAIGGGGSQGHKGNNSPLCEPHGGVINYKPIINMKKNQWFTCTSDLGCDENYLYKGFHPIVKNRFPYTESGPTRVDKEKPLVHLSRGKSGNGGDAGKGGIIQFQNSPKPSNLALFVNSGTPGQAGEIAQCGPLDDLTNQNINRFSGVDGNTAQEGQITY